MPHSITLITTIAVSFGLALLMGLIANRLKLPVLVGYLTAGVILGSNTPGFVADIELSGQLAEIGVILLMFGVGLHFSSERFTGSPAYCPARRGGADRGGNDTWSHCVSCLGLEHGCRHRIRPTPPL